MTAPLTDEQLHELIEDGDSVRLARDLLRARELLRRALPTIANYDADAAGEIRDFLGDTA